MESPLHSSTMQLSPLSQNFVAESTIFGWATFLPYDCWLWKVNYRTEVQLSSIERVVASTRHGTARTRDGVGVWYLVIVRVRSHPRRRTQVHRLALSYEYVKGPSN